MKLISQRAESRLATNIVEAILNVLYAHTLTVACIDLIADMKVCPTKNKANALSYIVDDLTKTINKINSIEL